MAEFCAMSKSAGALAGIGVSTMAQQFWASESRRERCTPRFNSVWLSSSTMASVVSRRAGARIMPSAGRQHHHERIDGCPVACAGLPASPSAIPKPAHRRTKTGRKLWFSSEIDAVKDDKTVQDRIALGEGGAVVAADARLRRFAPAQAPARTWLNLAASSRVQGHVFNPGQLFR